MQDSAQMPLAHGKGHMVIKVLGILALTTIVVVAMVRDRIVNNPQWQVSVTGQGKISYTPDIALVTLGVQIDKAPNAQEALRRLNEAMDKIIPAVQKAGIPADDIQTQNYSLTTQYDYRENTSIVSGYNANQQIIIKVKNLTAEKNLVSTVIDEASKAGANQVLGISFDVSNLNDLKQEARIAAIADAKSKAGSLSKAAGVKLGKVIGWWENYVQGPGSPTPYYYGGSDKGGMGAGGPVPQVPVATQELIVEMNVNYRIK